MKANALFVAALVVAASVYPLSAQNVAGRHGRFPPQDLGLLESPDREAWQKPDEIMDALAYERAA